jgi:hypothetical protein
MVSQIRSCRHGKSNQKLSAVLDVVSCISKYGAKKGRGVAAGNEPIKEVFQVAVLFMNILDQFVKAEEHTMDHPFEYTW